jgi:hypothetical protein
MASPAVIQSLKRFKVEPPGSNLSGYKRPGFLRVKKFCSRNSGVQQSESTRGIE